MSHPFNFLYDKLALFDLDRLVNIEVLLCVCEVGRVKQLRLLLAQLLLAIFFLPVDLNLFVLDLRQALGKQVPIQRRHQSQVVAHQKLLAVILPQLVLHQQIFNLLLAGQSTKVSPVVISQLLNLQRPEGVRVPV